MNKLPIIYSAHHASSEFGEFTKRCALTKDQRIRFSDYGTEKTVPKNGIAIIGEYSRGLSDLNRPSDKNKDIFPTHDFARPVRNVIWQEGQELTVTEKARLKQTVYDSYHNKILKAIKEANAPCVVVGWDNTAQYTIGADEHDVQQEMKSFILSNRGKQESAGVSKKLNEQTSCDPKMLIKVAELLKKYAPEHGLPNEVHLNLVMKGGYVTQTYSSLRNKNLPTKYPVQSFQVEYSTAITHSQKSLSANNVAIDNMRVCFERVMHETYNCWLKSL